MEKLLITINEASEMTGVCRSKAYKFANDGTWPTMRIGRSIKISLHGLKAWIKKQTEETREDR